MKSLIFARRNALEMVRDPVLYIFCLGFPVGMMLLFGVIDRFSGGATPTFAPATLVPGLVMFSFSFVMLVLSLLVSRDRNSSFLRRLYTAPIPPRAFVLGYALPCVAVGLLQAVVCVAAGALWARITKSAYFSFGQGVLLILTQIPILLVFVFLGILFGTVMNEKSAPGLTSVLITGSGLLGGAWMPLDTMGGLEVFCRWLPFWPSVIWGRAVTGAVHTIPSSTGEWIPYALDRTAALGAAVVVLYLAAAAVLSFWAFGAQMQERKK